MSMRIFQGLTKKEVEFPEGWSRKNEVKFPGVLFFWSWNSPECNKPRNFGVFSKSYVLNIYIYKYIYTNIYIQIYIYKYIYIYIYIYKDIYNTHRVRSKLEESFCKTQYVET